MFRDASRHQNEAKSDPIWVDFGLILETFLEEANMQNLNTVHQFLPLFGDLEGPQNGFKSDLKTSIPKMIPKCLKMAPEGVDLEAFGSLFGVNYASQF